MSCLHFSLRTDTLRTALLVVAAGLGGAHALAQAPAAPAASATGGEADLVQRARAWLASAHQVSPASIGVQSLDARLQVRPCAAGWAFDRPFAQNDGVLRARCPDTQWQLFLGVTLPRPAAIQAPVAAQAPGPVRPFAQAPTFGASPAPSLAAAATSPVMPVSTYMQPPAQAQGQAQAPTPLVVRRGHTVLTTWTPAEGLVVSARMESLDDGRVGDMIRVRNRDSGRILSAQVSGQGQALGQ